MTERPDIYASLKEPRYSQEQMDAKEREIGRLRAAFRAHAIIWNPGVTDEDIDSVLYPEGRP